MPIAQKWADGDALPDSYIVMRQDWHKLFVSANLACGCA